MYVSPSIRHALGHDPADLVGRSVSEMCHPADRVPLERELKDAGVAQAGTVRLLYRMRVGPHFASSSPGATTSFASPSTSAFASTASSFASGSTMVSPAFASSSASPAYPSIFAPSAPEYVWIEAAGRLHLEAGKGRKAIIMCARRVRVPARPHGGVGGLRAWAVLDNYGNVLSSSSLSTSKTQDPHRVVVPEPGHSFSEIAHPPGNEFLRRVIAKGSAPIGALAIDLAPPNAPARAKVVLSVREDRVLAEVRDEGPDPPSAPSSGGLVDEMDEAHTQSWQYALNHLKQQNAALREKIAARNAGAGSSGSGSTLGKRSLE